ncbi:MAG: hypothetical protein ACLSFO_02575 [Anaerovoracaceae bacterium]
MFERCNEHGGFRNVTEKLMPEVLSENPDLSRVEIFRDEFVTGGLRKILENLKNLSKGKDTTPERLVQPGIGTK